MSRRSHSPDPAGPPRRATSGTAGDDGFASLTFPILLWALVVSGIAILDVGAYLVTAARAQQVADAAALAAVSAGIDSRESPRAAASAVVAAGRGGRLETCECRATTSRHTVAVSMAVPGLVVPRFGAARVTATASAEAVDVPTGPPATWRPLDR